MMFDQSHQDEISSLCFDIADSVARELAVRIKLDEYTLGECYIWASKSVHMLTADSSSGYSHFKYAGLMCFWVRKLKPFTIGTENIAKSKVPINEYLALHIGVKIIQCTQIELLKQRQVADDEVGRMLDLTNKRLGYMERHLVSSLRYHHHAPASTVLLLEALTRVDGEV